MRRTLALLILLAAALPAAVWGDGPSVQASKIWIREGAPGVTVLGGYLSLANLTAKPLQLTAVSSPDFDSVEMHRSFVKDGMESMEPVPAVDIPAHGSVDFKPGGFHLMLMQPKKNLFAGDMVTLMLTFSDKSELAIMAPVRRDPPLR